MKNISKLSILVLMLVFASCKDAKTEATTETTAIENSDNTVNQRLVQCILKLLGNKERNVLNAEWN
jgi:hypothetical protein